MKARLLAAMVVMILAAPMTASGQVLYMEDFDVDNSANWLLSANEGFGQSPSDGVGEPDATADFFFDYSTVGIPAAPNSAGGSTRGMMIQANLIAGIFGGASASPIGQSFEGDYRVTFDLWGNYVGDPNTGITTGGEGQSNMSTYGILTDGETGLAPGVAEGLWFAGMVDGGSGADFRAYSIERSISYQHPPDCATCAPEDLHATHHADSRNNTAALYADNFGGASAPQAQIDLFPQQTGTTPAGSLGMEWHEMEIEKIGNIVTWSVDGVLLITVDMTNFTTQPDGTNIAFGHSDINAGSSPEPDRFDLQFSLFDNIKVEAISAGLVGDHNGDGNVDAADYVHWRKNNSGNAQGYTDWRTHFGESSTGAAVAGVPEPTALALMLMAVVPALFHRHRA